MIELRLHIITTKLDGVFELANIVEEDELRSHLARYLCVLTSGYVEESMKIIIEAYASKNGSPSLVKYISWHIRNLTNLNSEKIENILSSFNPSLKDSYLECLSDEQKDAFDSVVANRNNIAHGRNVGVSYVRVCNWYQQIKNTLDNIRLIMSI